jgi:4-hydroxyphenylpyruvate dioxygenase
VRVVLNKETEGHAATAFNARGTTVCDIGLRVADAQAVVDRAGALGISPFSQPIGPGEMDIPAIRGLSGSVLHFIDEGTGLEHVWQVEFGQSETPAGAGITGIDHIAQTMSYEDMLSWTLFYTSVFDMRKSAMVDVFDPDGLVRSQVVESPDGALKITLNGADSHRTLAGRFLSETFGASVQHVALATDDIFSTLTDMTARGFEPLPMPQNYYDDLAARFDIAPDLLARMQELNVLYDHDEKGAFFQCYSKAFAGGLFFEILQRDPGYTGFGAPNAPFRIAAQKRQVRGRGMPAR